MILAKLHQITSISRIFFTNLPQKKFIIFHK